jgi:hypothetical protein
MTDKKSRVLTPFNPRESITTQQAAIRAGKSSGTIRYWCNKHGIGRKIAGEMHISRVALEMLLEGDTTALALYHAGIHDAPPVQQYFHLFALD